jgi:hypothetical protein
VNWLAWDSRSYGGALLGGLLGLVAFHLLLGQGHMQPWLIGVGMGLGCAVLTSERSTMRGLVLACMAAWGGAVAQVALYPQPADAGLFDGLIAFHSTLDLPTFLLHLIGIAGAFAFGKASFRRGASERAAGAGREVTE